MSILNESEVPSWYVISILFRVFMVFSGASPIQGASFNLSVKAMNIGLV